MQKGLILKTWNFQSKLETFTKLKKKKNSIGISIFGYENKVNYPIYVSKNCCKHKQVDLLLIGEEGKRHYLLIKGFKVFMYDYTLHQYITEGKIFVVVIYQLSEQQSYWNVILETVLRLIVNKGLRCQKKWTC